MTDDVTTTEDTEVILEKEPDKSKGWLDMIAEAEKAFKTYQEKADSIDKMYANLEKLAGNTRDRQFQMFWANIQVLGPSIYSRPPVPVVVPRFKDRKPVPRVASELLERCTIVGFENQDVDLVMRQVRDDLTVLARGCAWVRYEASGKDNDFTQSVCIDHVDRKDWLCTPARSWKEVDMVAKRSHLTRGEMRKRFRKHSGKAYQDAAYEARKDNDEGDDGRKKAAVWEIWCKSQNKVVWVTEGVDVVLDSGKPHLKLEGFFPCPRPAYSTLQRRTLIPVPDVVFYKDQLEEINELTARIGALSDALKVRGFYPAGAGEIGDAIESALKSTSDNQVMIPVSNWAALGNGAPKDTIVWLPIDQIATTIVQCVELRKQLIADVYEITGLSDIMRGSTDANETLGAQELKSQYGSIRIRDRQNELVRFARDLVRISAEIMAENFAPKTMLEMSQLDIESDADVAEEVKPLEEQIKSIVKQVEQVKTDPRFAQLQQGNPQAAQQAMAMAKQQVDGLLAQIDKLKEKPTIEKVTKLLRDQRMRPFVLDIETDSTIAPDENAQKQRATEFVTAVGGFMREALPLGQTVPQAAPLMAETLKYVASQFRAGRQLDGVIDEFADQMQQQAASPKPNPEQAKADAEAQAIQQKQQADQQDRMAKQQQDQADQQRKAQEAMQSQQREDARLDADLKNKAADDTRKSLESEIRISQMQADDNRKAQEHGQKLELGALQIKKLELEIAGVKVKTDAVVASTEAKIEQTETQTDNSIRSTEAGVQATHDKTAIAAESVKAQASEPA